MDWATFLQGNSQSMFTLAGVFLGAVITFLINYSNNRFQARERDKDREEQKREARTLLNLDLKRSDIKIIEDAIDNRLKFLDEIQLIILKREFGIVSNQDMMAEVKSTIVGGGDKKSALGELNMIADKLANTVGNEFHKEYNNFYTLSLEYFKSATTDPLADQEVRGKLHTQLISSAGKLHNMLIDKLISLRSP